MYLDLELWGQKYRYTPYLQYHDNLRNSDTNLEEFTAREVDTKIYRIKKATIIELKERSLSKIKSPCGLEFRAPHIHMNIQGFACIAHAAQYPPHILEQLEQQVKPVVDIFSEKHFIEIKTNVLRHNMYEIMEYLNDNINQLTEAYKAAAAGLTEDVSS